MLNNEFFPIPLYHGTSSLFLDNILKHGLNGINQLSEYNLIPLMEIQSRLLESYDSKMSEWVSIKDSTKHMIGQIDDRWQHGKTYLTCSEHTASKYASLYIYGSELLTRCMLLQQIIKTKNIHNDFLEKEFFKRGLHKLIGKVLSPIVFTIDRVEVDKLIPINNASIQDVINQINNTNTKTDGKPNHIPAFLQQVNFTIAKGQIIKSFNWKII